MPASPNRRLGRAIAQLASSTAGGQVLLLAIAPILTRLYSPDSFGAFSTFSAAALVLGAVAAGKLEAAVTLLPSEEEAAACARLCLVIAIAVGGFCLLSTSLLMETVQDEVGEEHAVWAWLVPPLVTVTAAYTTLSQLALRARAYATVATRTLWQSGGTAFGQVTFAGLGDNAGGLLGGQLVGRVVAIASLTKQFPEWLHRPRQKCYSAILRRHWRLPVVFAPSALLNVLGTQFPLILIATYSGAAAAGQLGLAQRIVLAPTALVGTAVAQVFAAELAVGIREGQESFRSQYLRTSLRLAVLGAVVGLVAAFLAPWAFPILFGAQWKVSGQMAQALSISLALGLTASPVSYVFVALQRSWESIVLDVLRIALVGGSGLVGILMGLGPVELVWIMFLGQATNYLATWILGWYVSGRPRQRLYLPR